MVVKTQIEKKTPNHKSRTLTPILTSKASFYPELRGESTELQNCQKKPSPRGLGPKSKLRANWAQKTYQALILEP